MHTILKMPPTPVPYCFEVGTVAPFTMNPKAETCDECQKNKNNNICKKFKDLKSIFVTGKPAACINDDNFIETGWTFSDKHTCNSSGHNCYCSTIKYTEGSPPYFAFTPVPATARPETARPETARPEMPTKCTIVTPCSTSNWVKTKMTWPEYEVDISDDEKYQPYIWTNNKGDYLCYYGSDIYNYQRNMTFSPFSKRPQDVCLKHNQQEGTGTNQRDGFIKFNHDENTFGPLYSTIKTTVTRTPTQTNAPLSESVQCSSSAGS